ncbi:hypothetical protein Q75_15715 [Bacillus coahuilensis p1.1.43]|uniref:Uncharacterized protein n=1 Tax=Bacillus coahuilensis p1.1.43 TaxID=1150625 RepID=A0A147K4T7_9BACI|nr:hypothetical protein [Bacillus coahuilensis]KUP04434.1 hypothetical protein Q75_15715 [Bacillus coahuilensis p1.1.43]
MRNFYKNSLKYTYNLGDKQLVSFLLFEIFFIMSILFLHFFIVEDFYQLENIQSELLKINGIEEVKEFFVHSLMPFLFQGIYIHILMTISGLVFFRLFNVEELLKFINFMESVYSKKNLKRLMKLALILLFFFAVLFFAEDILPTNIGQVTKDIIGDLLLLLLSILLGSVIIIQLNIFKDLFKKRFIGFGFLITSSISIFYIFLTKGVPIGVSDILAYLILTLLYIFVISIYIFMIVFFILMSISISQAEYTSAKYGKDLFRRKIEVENLMAFMMCNFPGKVFSNVNLNLLKNHNIEDKILYEIYKLDNLSYYDKLQTVSYYLTINLKLESSKIRGQYILFRNKMNKHLSFFLLVNTIFIFAYVQFCPLFLLNRYYSSYY